MKITKTKNSRLVGSDPNNVVFGNSISDHMLICTYKDGAWGEPEILPYGSMGYSPALMAIHYGQAIFEGMKAYKDAQGDVFLFRPERNFERFNKSAERMAMPQIPKEIYLEGLKTLIDLDRDWIPFGNDSSLYIRPVMFASEEMFIARVSKEYTFAIMSSPSNRYYNKPLKLKVATHYTRAVDGGVGFTKCAGNYGSSFYPTELAKAEGYDQVIWTDSKEHKYFEESGTMNVFVRIGNTLITPPTSGTILNGVTRNSLINIAKHLGLEVKEERISIDDIVEAYKKGELKEVFGCGTAVIVTQYSHVAYNDLVMELPTLTADETYALKLKEQLIGIQTNRLEDPFDWRFKVEKNISATV